MSNLPQLKILASRYLETQTLQKGSSEPSVLTIIDLYKVDSIRQCIFEDLDPPSSKYSLGIYLTNRQYLIPFKDRVELDLAYQTVQKYFITRSSS
jgi:hypothetical protein